MYKINFACNRKLFHRIIVLKPISRLVHVRMNTIEQYRSFTRGILYDNKTHVIFVSNIFLVLLIWCVCVCLATPFHTLVDDLGARIVFFLAAPETEKGTQNKNKNMRSF